VLAGLRGGNKTLETEMKRKSVSRDNSEYAKKPHYKKGGQQKPGGETDLRTHQALGTNVHQYAGRKVD